MKQDLVFSVKLQFGKTLVSVQNKGGLSGVEVEPELIAKHIGNSGWI